MKKGEIDKKILEIVNGDMTLIGGNDKPSVSPNVETRASKTTDQNIRISRQQFGDNFLSRFGYYFYENEKKQVSSDIIDSTAEIQFNRFRELTHYILSNIDDEELMLSLIKTANKNYSDLTDEEKKSDVKWAKKSLDTVLKSILNKDKIVSEDIIPSQTKDNELVFDGKINLSDVVVKSKFESLVDIINNISKNKKDDMFNIILKLISLSSDILTSDDKSTLISKIKTVIETSK